jgi:transposase
LPVADRCGSAFLLERGITFAKSPAKLRQGMLDVLEDAASNLTPRMRNTPENGL